MATLEELIKIRDEEIVELKDQIAELEETIYQYEENDAGILVSETEKKMLDIIFEQIKILAESSKVEKLDKEDVKLFDTYVKDIVAIRGKLPTPKISKDQEGEATEAELLQLVQG